MGSVSGKGTGVMVEIIVLMEVMKKIVMCGVWNLNGDVMDGSTVKTTVMKKAVFVTRHSWNVPVEGASIRLKDVTQDMPVQMEVTRKAVYVMKTPNGHVTADIVNQPAIDVMVCITARTKVMKKAVVMRIQLCQGRFGPVIALVNSIAIIACVYRSHGNVMA